MVDKSLFSMATMQAWQALCSTPRSKFCAAAVIDELGVGVCTSNHFSALSSCSRLNSVGRLADLDRPIVATRFAASCMLRPFFVLVRFQLGLLTRHTVVLFLRRSVMRRRGCNTCAQCMPLDSLAACLLGTVPVQSNRSFTRRDQRLSYELYFFPYPFIVFRSC